MATKEEFMDAMEGPWHPVDPNPKEPLTSNPLLTRYNCHGKVMEAGEADMDWYFCRADEALPMIERLQRELKIQDEANEILARQVEEWKASAAALAVRRTDETTAPPHSHEWVIDSERRPGEVFCLHCGVPEKTSPP